LDYFLARYYSSAQGRFTSPDPLFATGRSGIPKNWNRYAYCINNPLAYVDSSGLAWWIKEGSDQPQWFNLLPQENGETQTKGWRVLNSDEHVYESADGWAVLDPSSNDFDTYDTQGEALESYSQLIDQPYNISVLDSISEMSGYIGIGSGLLRLGRAGFGLAVARREATAVAEERVILGVGAASADEFVTRVLNSNMAHAAERAVERAGFSTIQEARLALQQLGKQIKEAGVIPSTAIKDTAYADRILVPGFGQGGAVVYQVRQGVLRLKTVLEWRP
jgi:hypothetical protein